ncbi:hypothetical protein KCU99_g323, partial [Aureobasidium melanogenum]
MSHPVKPWFDDLEDCFDDDSPEQERFYLACAIFRQTHGYDPDDDSATAAQRAEFYESVLRVPAELEKRCLHLMDHKAILAVRSASTSVQNNTMSTSGPESGNANGNRNVEKTDSRTSSTTNDSGAVQDSSEGTHPEHKQESQEIQEKSLNSDAGPKFSLDNMSTPVFDKSSRPLSPTSHEDAQERGPLDMSKGKHTNKEQLVSKDESTSDPWSNVMQTTIKDEAEVNKYLSKRLQHWKDKLATKKHPSLNNEDEQSLPSDILDFNASMLDREDYAEMLHSAATNKQWDKIDSNSTIEKVSSSEQSTAINALLYGLYVLKAASPIQQHEMVTSLLHPKVRKMQPSLAFEMNALLLELDTQKLLTMSVDEDALHVKAKKVARAWGVALSSLEDDPSGLAW